MKPSECGIHSQVHSRMEEEATTSKKKDISSKKEEMISKAQKGSKSENPYEHRHYTYVKNEKEADSIGWVFLNRNELIKFPFKFEEMPEDHIRVDVLYSGISESDVMLARGKWADIDYPICLGHEIVGRVSKVGNQVKSLSTGDIVALGSMRTCCGSCSHCEQAQGHLCCELSRQEKLIPGEFWGGHCTVIQSPATYAVKIPEGLPLQSAPPLISAVTCFAPIRRYVHPGQKTAVIGIGGLGHLAVQFLSRFGTQVTAFTSCDRREEIKSLGAHEVVSSCDLEELKKHKEKFDVIISTIPATKEELFDSYLKMTASGGHFVMVGLAPRDEKVVFNPKILVFRNIRLVGSFSGSRKDLIDTLEFAAKNNIEPKVELFDFEDLPKAFERLEKEKPMFRCVVNVKDWAEKRCSEK